MLTLKQTSTCKVPDETGREHLSDCLTERQNGQGDLDIIVNEKKTKVHRQVLISCSDYFESMFTGGFAETESSSINLSDVFETIEDLNTVLDYIYTGDIKLSEENICSVLNSACLFLLNDLQEICSTFLTGNISPKTCICIYSLAEKYNLESVKDVCMEVIKAWFPVNLYCKPETLALSPHILNIFVQEGVLKISDKLLKQFLGKWQEYYEKSSTNIPLPKELSDLLKDVCKTKESNQEACDVPEKEASGNKTEDVLLSVFKASAPNVQRCCIDVRGLVPKRNIWKFFFQHKFCELVKPSTVPSLIGMTKDKAFFLFLKEELCDSEECVISVDLKTNAEHIIKIPDSVSGETSSYYGDNPHYFMWEEDLCSLFLNSQSVSEWSLFKLVGDSHWEKLCEINIISNSGEFLTKACEGTLYIWMKEYVFCGSALANIDYSFAKLVKLPEKYELIQLESGVPRVELGETPTGYSNLSTVSYNSEGKVLTFVHIVDSYDDLSYGGEEAWDEELVFEVRTYDIEEDSWFEHGESAMDYPEPNFTIPEPPTRMYETKRPIQLPTKRLTLAEGDESVCNPHVEKESLETCVGALYYMKTTCPYNTYVWELDEYQSEWKLVSRLPYSLDKFPFFQTVQLSMDCLSAMPDSYFEDFSEEIGISALPVFHTLHEDIDIEFAEELLKPEIYEQQFGELWHAAFK